MGVTSLRETYSGKRVFLTGHTGFKGSWMSLWLSEMGAITTGYSLEPPTDPSLFNVLDLQSTMDHHIGDIRDADKLAAAMEASEAEIVFHLAAQPLVQLSYNEPALTFDTNVMGTVNLLEAVRKTKSVRACVIVTSDKCYENREWVYAYRENDPMGGYDPYSASKGCSELVTAAYRQSFFNAETSDEEVPGIASARAGNVIGGGDWAEARILPDIARAIHRDETIELRNPSAVRPWQHVLEPLGGYLLLGALLAENPRRYSEAWNFGPIDCEFLPVSEVVERAISTWGKGSYSTPENHLPHEANLLMLDTSKTVGGLNWKPRYSTVEAIERSIAWYRDYYNDSDPKKIRAMSVKDVQDYAQGLSFH